METETTKDAVSATGTTDAVLWAREFVRSARPGVTFDEQAMVGWFANAIEAGRREGQEAPKGSFPVLIDGEPMPARRIDSMVEGMVAVTYGDGARDGALAGFMHHSRVAIVQTPRPAAHRVVTHGCGCVDREGEGVSPCAAHRAEARTGEAEAVARGAARTLPVAPAGETVTDRRSSSWRTSRPGIESVTESSPVDGKIVLVLGRAPLEAHYYVRVGSVWTFLVDAGTVDPCGDWDCAFDGHALRARVYTPIPGTNWGMLCAELRPAFDTAGERAVVAELGAGGDHGEYCPCEGCRRNQAEQECP